MNATNSDVIFLHFFMFVFFPFLGNAQQFDKRMLDYFPVQKSEVSEEDHRKAIYILERTYEAIRKDSLNSNFIHHLNLATAFIFLKEPKQAVLDQFELAQQKDLESTAEIFDRIYSPNRLIGKYFSKEEYDSLITRFETINMSKKEEDLNLDSYINEGNYDAELVKLMHDLSKRDQLHRKSKKGDMGLQTEIDQENLLVIDSIFNHYGKYIGRSMVGKKFDYVMWAVIQHADLYSQEAYLEVVHEAVLNEELSEMPFRMLIDRIYARKYGYQVFGSQSGVTLGTEEQINQVKVKYKLQL